MNHLCKQVVFILNILLNQYARKRGNGTLVGFIFSVKNKTLGKAYSIDIDGKIL